MKYTIEDRAGKKLEKNIHEALNTPMSDEEKFSFAPYDPAAGEKTDSWHPSAQNEEPTQNQSPPSIPKDYAHNL